MFVVLFAFVSAGLIAWFFAPSKKPSPAMNTSVAIPAEGPSATADATGRASAGGNGAPKAAAVPKPAGWAGKDLYVAYERARDLADFIDILKADVDRGDPNAQGVYARALSECAILSVNPFYLDDIPAYNERLKKDGRTPIPDEVVKHYADRCRQLASSRKITTAEIETLQHNAESGGDPFSFAIHFADIAPNLTPEDRQQEILSILQSGNPYAVTVLAELMGQPIASKTDGYGNFAGAAVDKYAWEFVACDLGMDCSNTGWLATVSCLRYFLCGAGDYKSIVENGALSPADYQQALELERRILVAFQTGNVEGTVFGK
jgi:hypothetical protein